MPIAATTQSVAAVVRPRTDRPSRMIAPAPRKPMPVTICAAIRDGSARTTFPPCVRNSWNPYAETIVNRHEPSDTSKCVRSPASRSRSSRSTPIARPRPAATTRRTSASQLDRDGMSVARSVDRLLLVHRELLDPGRGELEQLVEPLAVERHALGGRLHLDEVPLARHHDVEVDLGVRVLRVVAVEQRRAVDDADGDGRDRGGEGLHEAEAVERAPGGDVGAADRRAARPTVGLQHVAVEVDGALAEGLEVDDSPERTSDQAL